MSLVAVFLQNGTFPLFNISQYKVMNFTFTMQLLMLLVSGVAVMAMYFYDRAAFIKFFRPGARASGGDSNWQVYGPLMILAFGMGSVVMLSGNVMAEHGTINTTFFSLLPAVLLFAATNAWSEEIVSRFVIVAGLEGKLEPVTICWVSGILFGAAHFFSGTPNGLFGFIMTGILGGLLAKSVIETRGLGWALLIHFILDCIIFGAGAMVLAGQK